MDYNNIFKGKKITVMGLGLLGRGVGDAKFLAEEGAELTITDLKSEEELSDSLSELSSYGDIKYHLGGHNLADFQDKDYILKAAGVPLDSRYVAEARKNEIPIKMSASWFAELTQIPIVGITGTRGKSTTTHLIYEILKGAGMEVLLGGNVQGVSTLALLPDVTTDSIAVMELDSWQCQGFGEAKISPEVAVFTTFMPDHLNYYPDMDAYLKDKAQIFLNQKPEATLIVGKDVAPLLKEKYGRKIRSHTVIADGANFPKGWKLQIPGEHNKLNAVSAIEGARALGLEDEVIRKAVENFHGVSGRLEFVRELKGVRFYNDTTATTPEATIVGLEALDPDNKKNILLIMGGADKGLDISRLPAAIEDHVKKTYILKGSGSARFAPDTSTYPDLESAVQDAMEDSKEGDIILLSPAFASFGMFMNEFDRGDKFRKFVQNIS